MVSRKGNVQYSFGDGRLAKSLGVKFYADSEIEKIMSIKMESMELVKNKLEKADIVLSGTRHHSESS